MGRQVPLRGQNGRMSSLQESWGDLQLSIQKRNSTGRILHIKDKGRQAISLCASVHKVSRVATSKDGDPVQSSCDYFLVLPSLIWSCRISDKSFIKCSCRTWHLVKLGAQQGCQSIKTNNKQSRNTLKECRAERPSLCQTRVLSFFTSRQIFSKTNTFQFA